MAKIIDGKAIAAKIRGEIAEGVKELKSQGLHRGWRWYWSETTRPARSM